MKLLADARSSKPVIVKDCVSDYSGRSDRSVAIFDKSDNITKSMNMANTTTNTGIIKVSQVDKEQLIKKLEHLNLRNLSLCDDGTWALAANINNNNFIRIVDLSYNLISDEGIQSFSACIHKLQALDTLKLVQLLLLLLLLF
jgi:hypothetical protein